MDRRGFFGFLGWGAVAAAVAPAAMVKTLEATATPTVFTLPIHGVPSRYASKLPELYLARLSFLEDALFERIELTDLSCSLPTTDEWYEDE